MTATLIPIRPAATAADYLAEQAGHDRQRTELAEAHERIRLWTAHGASLGAQLAAAREQEREAKRMLAEEMLRPRWDLPAALCVLGFGLVLGLMWREAIVLVAGWLG